MLEVGWWGSGVIKGSFQNILKQGARVVRGGRVLEGVTTPAPPQKILIVHQGVYAIKLIMVE